MITYVNTLSKDKEMPITIKSVITGRAIPNAQQLNEMNNTAAQVQAKVTEERRAEKEMARENAERQRAGIYARNELDNGRVYCIASVGNN